MKFRHSLTSGALLLLTMSMSSLAAAQAQEALPEPAPLPEETLPQAQANFSDEQLESFVEVQTGLQAIQEEFTTRLGETDDAEAVGKLQQEANEEMIEVVQASELDVDTYNQIAQALRQDPALLQRVQQMVN